MASNQVVLSTGGDQFQTVTIVPSDGSATGKSSGGAATTGGGPAANEVSYVLIVQPPSGTAASTPGQRSKKAVAEGEDEDDMAVYDFDAEMDFGGDGGGSASVADGGDLDDKSKLIKMVPKRSQTVKTALWNNPSPLTWLPDHLINHR